ncbi:MAG: DUF4129 domain-containing protein [Anaerolineales bacterium]
MHRRQLMLILCLLVVAGAGILAASLHDVQFQPARPLGLSAGPGPQIALPRLEISSETPLWKILLLWLAFTLNLVLFFFLLPPEARRRIIRQVVSFALGVLALLIALRYHMIQLPEIAGNPVEAAGGGAPQFGSSGEAAPFQPPHVPPWMTYVASLVILWAVILVVWFFYRRWQLARGRRNASLATLADIARASLRDLGHGREWGDVVVETYARMNDTVSAHRGLSRAAASTPREFAERLADAGLPPDSVGRLTGLFESVRYGGHPSTERDMREAVACLESIVRACGAQA